MIVMNQKYDVIAAQENYTVMGCYTPLPREDTGYQSEAQLESSFIKQLVELGYTYVDIKTEAHMIANLRQQMDRLNKVELTENEWQYLFKKRIAKPNESVMEKADRIQRNEIVNITRDDGSSLNIKLIDKKDIFNNQLQVINQYTPENGKRENRYDVTILVNGLPLVHCELKRRGVALKEAFNQINRYGRESFWAGSGLYDFIQIFVISNGTETKYYSNTTRYAHVDALNKSKTPQKIQSQSFEFTSYWADAANNTILDLVDFANTFLVKRTLLNILTKYCVFTCDKNLLVMRPYQIAATERILERINRALKSKLQGTTDGGGYIWHTTGSGKTLTSFKTAQLASQIPEVDKVLFVVDRKDLDYQTMKEYDNFEEGCANSNNSAAILKKQLNDPSLRIIITTLQKLSSLIKSDKDSVNANENVVFIFDECHRSQFGEMHVAITKHFKNYMIFGFTGTPIFTKNAGSGKNPTLRTTEQAFGDSLHQYTIIDAIRDRNVLKFKVDYVSTVKSKSLNDHKKVWGIDTEEALSAPIRISNNVSYILEHFSKKTKRNEIYSKFVIKNVSDVAKSNKTAEIKSKEHANGFNSIFAVESIPMAMRYYEEFKKQQESLPVDQRLKVATIFTFSQNEEENDMGNIDDEDPSSTDKLDASSRDFLDLAIGDYNQLFGTNYDTSSDKFQNYYKDLSLRMKNKEIDILIVVSMFLTGFDAQSLNTLWVDKNLRMHGLLQAYSRTNRILNSIKDCGNIVCFRNLEEATNESFSLFGDKNASGLILMRSFSDYYYGFVDDNGEYVKGYVDLVKALEEQFPLPINPQALLDEQKGDFVRLFSAILRLENLLSAFDEFTEDKKLFAERELQDYTGLYITIRDLMKTSEDSDKTKESILDDLVFEMELVKQIQINIPYILDLVNKYHEQNCKDKELLAKIQSAIGASPDLRDKEELILNFIKKVSPEKGDIEDQWLSYISLEKENELKRIIVQKNLNEGPTRNFIDQAFKVGYISGLGTAIKDIMPSMGIFGDARGAREETKAQIIRTLTDYFNCYYNVV